MKIELEKTQFDNSIMQKKLIFTRKATEERIFETISNKESYREDPLLIAVLSATLNEDEFDIEGEEIQPSLSGEHLSRKDPTRSSSRPRTASPPAQQQ